jgi:phosphoenolpyruvate carboxylase
VRPSLVLTRALRAVFLQPQVYDALCTQTVDLVLTAHPTQAIRRSVLRMLNQIRNMLFRLRRERLSQIERYELEREVECLIQSAWRTDEINRSKPSPQDEMRSALAYFNETIFETLPAFLRRTDMALDHIGMPKLPLDHVPLKFSNWAGGDRDGNPFVTSEVTRDVILIANTAAVDMYVLPTPFPPSAA